MPIVAFLGHIAKALLKITVAAVRTTVRVVMQTTRAVGKLAQGIARTMSRGSNFRKTFKTARRLKQRERNSNNRSHNAFRKPLSSSLNKAHSAFAERFSNRAETLKDQFSSANRITATVPKIAPTFVQNHAAPIPRSVISAPAPAAPSGYADY